MAKAVAKGEQAIAKAKAKQKIRPVELKIWYENGKIRKRIADSR
jgi:antitoxin component YwqK of YwqJK toxin-antitoxin module